ncbi:hypothetical protein Dda3937_03352 [Dickeya dadantii 3937]|uniref:Uncharacterized protein n=1 Tax=Dickeya dadantii (strain 3937) TaxID=198628 RepID=E0SMY7_DICD3|nr:hypothetical protein Dda3937_03352 [Dickeya dadantii 3937]
MGGIRTAIMWLMHDTWVLFQYAASGWVYYCLPYNIYDYLFLRREFASDCCGKKKARQNKVTVKQGQSFHASDEHKTRCLKRRGISDILSR